MNPETSICISLFGITIVLAGIATSVGFIAKFLGDILDELRRHK